MAGWPSMTPLYSSRSCWATAPSCCSRAAPRYWASAVGSHGSRHAQRERHLFLALLYRRGGRRGAGGAHARRVFAADASPRCATAAAGAAVATVDHFSARIATQLLALVDADDDGKDEGTLLPPPLILTTIPLPAGTARMRCVS